MASTWKKGSEYEGGNRSPLIIQWPKKFNFKSVCDKPVIAYDIFATSIAAAGGKLKDDRVYHGQDLLEIKSGTYDFLSDHYFGVEEKNFAIREGKWKLLITEKQTSLFNLSEDKSEKKDLSVQYPEIKEELQKN